MRTSLKVAIVLAGKSQRALARELQIGESRLSAIVRGWVVPNPRERERLTQVLHIADGDLS